MAPNVLSILGITYTGRARVRAISVYGMVMGVAAVGGQLIGGLLIAANPAGLGWRAIFWVNVPVGIAALALARRIVPESRAAHAGPARPARRRAVHRGARRDRAAAARRPRPRLARLVVGVPGRRPGAARACSPAPARHGAARRAAAARPGDLRRPRVPRRADLPGALLVPAGRELPAARALPAAGPRAQPARVRRRVLRAGRRLPGYLVPRARADHEVRPPGDRRRRAVAAPSATCCWCSPSGTGESAARSPRCSPACSCSAPARGCASRR